MLYGGCPLSNDSNKCSCKQDDYFENEMVEQTSCGCGCGCMRNNCGCEVEPIVLEERVNIIHGCMYHEQPVIVPIENRFVMHHNHYPRYYTQSRQTRVDVVDDYYGNCYNNNCF